MYLLPNHTKIFRVINPKFMKNSRNYGFGKKSTNSSIQCQLVKDKVNLKTQFQVFRNMTELHANYNTKKIWISLTCTTHY